MGQKDLREKVLEDYEDVFSDIFNGLLFEDEVIKQQFLKASSTESIYKFEEGVYRDQRRDVLKEYMNECLLEIGSLGIENQSSVDNYISIRIMGYDYTKYRSQIDRKIYPILPVITIVLNFSDKQWNETKSLFSIMNIPEEFKAFLQDYKVRVFDIAFLEDNVIERFISDFKIVAKFFKNKRLGITNLFENDKICHIQEFLDLLAVFTNDNRYKDIKQELIKIEKEGKCVTMCNVAQALEDKGIEKGIQKGIEKGKLIQLIELVEAGDLTIEKASQKAGMTVDVFRERMIELYKS